MVIKVDCNDNLPVGCDESRKKAKYCILLSGTVDGDGYHPFNDIEQVKKLASYLWEEGYASCFDFLNVVEAEYYDYNGKL